MIFDQFAVTIDNPDTVDTTTDSLGIETISAGSQTLWLTI